MHFQMKGNYFNGDFHLPPTSGPDRAEHFSTHYCPADNEMLLWEMPVDFSYTDKIVESVHLGQKKLNDTILQQRLQLLMRFKESISGKTDKLINSIALETGRPLWDAKEEVLKSFQILNFSFEYASQSISSWVVTAADDKNKIYTRPIGPSVLLTPFHSPLALAIEQLVYTFLSGNSSVLKPSEKNIHTSQLIFEAFHEAQFPAGSVNMIYGPAEMSNRLLKEKIFKNVLFTGSPESGESIINLLGNHLNKRLSIQLNSNNTCVLDENINIDRIIPEMVRACFLSTGQKITSTSVIALREQQVSEFIDKFHSICKKIEIGHPLKSNSFMGPLINQKALDNYLLYVGMAKREGFEEIMRGKQINREEKGFYVSPSVHFAPQFKEKSVFLSTNTLAPSVVIIPYSKPEDALEICNLSEFGLISSLFTDNEKFKKLFINECQSGMIYINRTTTDLSCNLPFGGMKKSSNLNPAGVNVYQSGLVNISVFEDEFKQEETIDLQGIMD